MAAPVAAILPTRTNKTPIRTAGSITPIANQPEPQEPARQFHPLHPALPISPASIPADPPSDGRSFPRISASQTPLFVQRKLAVGASNDPLELEADSVAEEVMRADGLAGIASPAPPPQSRPSSANSSAAGMGNAPAIVHEALRSPSQPLDRETRAFMEPRLGRDLSAVRIHTGPQAADSAKAINARAYTAGNQIVWDAGTYAPHTAAGKRLLAHELAHVVQQDRTSPGPTTTIRRQMAGAVMDPPTTPAPDMPQPAEAVDAADHGTEETGKRNRQVQDAAATSLPGLDKMGPKAAQIRDSTRNEVQAKVQQALQTPGSAAGETADKEDDADEKKSVGDLSTGNLALIDTELAEHERWGAAASKVGAAGSGQRAEFIAQSAAGGSNFLESAGKGALLGGGIKGAEKVVEKGALRLATKFAPAVGKFAPLPAVGAVIGGVMSAYDLASRDWKATGESIGRFGEGADVYDTLANSIESISTIIDVATGVLNVIAGIVGAIAIAMWIITILTVGIASPLAATLSAIAGGIGLASMILDGINSLVLKQLITIFRSLHTFTSEADPRDVVTQGNAISVASGAATGFLGGLGGGLAGGAAAEKGLHLASGKPTPKVPDHPNPGARSGDGPTVKAEVGENTGGAGQETATSDQSGAGTTQPLKEVLPDTPPPDQQVAPVPLEIPPPEVKLEVPASPDAAPSAPAPIQSPALPEAPRPLEITAVPEKPTALEAKSGPDVPAPEKPVDAVKEVAPAARAEEKAPATAPETAGEPESRAENAPAQAEGKPVLEDSTGAYDEEPAKPKLKKNKERKLKAARKTLLQAFQKAGELSPEEFKQLNEINAQLGDPVLSQKQFNDLVNRVEQVKDTDAYGRPDKDVPIAPHEEVKPYLEKYTDPATGKRRLEQMPGRSTVDSRVKSSQRARARKAAGDLIARSLRSGVDDAYTARARAFLEPWELDYIERKGKLPPGIEFHHLMTVADFPEFAHLAEVGVPLNKEAHLRAHEYDTTKPLETPEIPESVLQKPGYSVDPESLPGARKKLGPGVIAESRRQIRQNLREAGKLTMAAEEAQKARAKARKKLKEISQKAKDATPGTKEAARLTEKTDQLRKQARESGKTARRLEAEARDRQLKAKLIEAALPDLDALVRGASDEGRVDLGKPAKVPINVPTPASTAVPALPETESIKGSSGAVPESEAPASSASAVAASPESKPPQPDLSSSEITTATQEPTSDPASELRARAIAETPPIPKPAPVARPHPIKIPAIPDQALPTPGPSTQPGTRPQIQPAELPTPAVIPQAPVEAAPVPGSAAVSPGQPAKAPKPPINFSHLPLAARSGVKPPVKSEGKDSEEPESGLTRNIRSIGEVANSKMTPAEQVVLSVGGPLAGTAGVNTMRGFEEARREPIVEHVNPNYAPPPCTPQDIVDVENQIIETLDARAQSEKAAAIMAGQQAHHKANEKPLADVQKGTEEAISATEAHKQAVEHRTQANAKKKQNEDHAQGTLADYSDKAAKLAVITVPMRGFNRFTSLAKSLPDTEDDLSTAEDIAIRAVTLPWNSTQSTLDRFIVPAKYAILKANADSGRFLKQLDTMDDTIEQQKAAHGERDKQVAADASTLKDTGKNADQSGDELNKAQETSKDLDAKNKDRLKEASQLHNEASKNAATLDGQAQQKQGQSQSLASSLQEWAQVHQQARKDSLEETKLRLKQQGYKITEIKEL